MNKYQKIKSYDVDTLAGFIYGLIAQTEDNILGKLSALGVEVSICTLAEDLRIAQIKRDLLEEQDDT
jgi:hypothetical protein